MTGARPAWTDEREAELQRLRDRGYSRPRIAELLGISLNAVIGKVFRMERDARTRHQADPVNVPAPVPSPRAARSTWTDEQLDVLRTLWRSRMTSTAIAAQVGHSVNGTNSKAHALGLPDRRRMHGRYAGVGFNFKGRSRKGPSVKPPKPGEKPRKKKSGLCRLTDVPDRHHCVYPIGHPDDSDFRFCGDRAVPGRPYCLEHCYDCYQTRAVSEGIAA